MPRRVLLLVCGVVLPAIAFAVPHLRPDPAHGIVAELKAAAADPANHAAYADLVRGELASVPRRQVATFSMPCFWAGEAHFGSLDGVYRTTPGYLNGKEVVRVEYDPAVTSYDALLAAPDTAADRPGLCRWDATRVAASKLDPTFKPDDEFPAWFLRQADGLKFVPMTPAQTARIDGLVHAELPYEQLLSPGQRALLAKVRRDLDGAWTDYAGGFIKSSRSAVPTPTLERHKFCRIFAIFRSRFPPAALHSALRCGKTPRQHSNRGGLMSVAEFPLLAPVKNYISTPRKLLIDGQWVAAQSGRTFETVNPATGDVLATVAEGDKADIDLAVKAARRAFESGPWAAMTASARGRLLWKVGDLIEEHGDELAMLESLDNGKPMAVARAADVPLAAELFRYMAGWVNKMGGEVLNLSVPYLPGSHFHAYTRREPIGVVGQIIPWNFPLLMAAWKLGPALATGCTVVMKPAEQTPLTCLRMAEMFEEAGFPKGVVNVVPGYGETAGAALANHHDVDKIAFTGSTEVGKLIVKAAAGNLKKVTLELGGKSPNIIFADSDVDAAIQGAASAIFFNHGQCCCAGSRLFVEKGIYDRVVEGVAKVANGMTLGHGLDPQTQMGPLVSQEQYDRVTGFFDSGRSEGATFASGGVRHGEKGYFVKPTVLTDVHDDMRVVKEEIFGPVVTATPFTDVDAIVKSANNSTYGLAAGIWTKDTSKAHRLAGAMRAGTVWINCYNVFDASMPFGGYKQSGWGREMGKEALELYTEVKSVCMQL